eukprot:UN06147
MHAAQTGASFEVDLFLLLDVFMSLIKVKMKELQLW